MNETQVLPAPILDPGPKSKWELEREAFYRMLPELLQTHRGKYVAIHDGKVVEIGEQMVATAKLAYARFGYLPIYVGFVASEPRIVALPSAHLVRASNAS